MKRLAVSLACAVVLSGARADLNVRTTEGPAVPDVVQAFRPAVAASQTVAAPNDTLTAVDGLKVGSVTLPGGTTGCTVILVDGEGVPGGVSQRGGAPGRVDKLAIKNVGLMLSGDTMDVRDFHGEPIHDDTFLMLLNAHHEPLIFILPGQEDVRWELIMDTRLEEGFLETPKIFAAADEHEMEARSFCLLRLSVGEQAHARADSWKKRQGKLAEAASKSTSEKAGKSRAGSAKKRDS